MNRDHMLGFPPVWGLGEPATEATMRVRVVNESAVPLRITSSEVDPPAADVSEAVTSTTEAALRIAAQIEASEIARTAIESFVLSDAFLALLRAWAGERPEYVTGEGCRTIGIGHVEPAAGGYLLPPDTPQELRDAVVDELRKPLRNCGDEVIEATPIDAPLQVPRRV